VRKRFTATREKKRLNAGLLKRAIFVSNINTSFRAKEKSTSAGKIFLGTAGSGILNANKPVFSWYSVLV